MNKKEIIESELEELDTLSNKFMERCRQELTKIRKEEVRLFLTTNDKYKLLILRSWEIKYQVPLSYILKTLVPFWEQFIFRRSRKMKQRGFNVKISTLTGKKSEQILIQMITKDFNGKNKILFISSEQDRILNKYTKVSDDIKVKTPKVTSVRKYVKSYKYNIQKNHKLREKIIHQFVQRPYRT